MATCEFVSDGQSVTEPSSAAGRRLAEVERLLEARMSGMVGCPNHPHEMRLRVFGKQGGGLAVSVVDCCCDRHSRQAREAAEQELRHLLGQQAH